VQLFGLTAYTVLNTEKESVNMDIFSAGFLVVGVSGASVLLLTILEKHGLKINHTAINIILEMSKAGMLLYILKHLSKLFW
jgi:hypothetical protein